MPLNAQNMTIYILISFIAVLTIGCGILLWLLTIGARALIKELRDLDNRDA